MGTSSSALVHSVRPPPELCCDGRNRKDATGKSLSTLLYFPRPPPPVGAGGGMRRSVSGLVGAAGRCWSVWLFVGVAAGDLWASLLVGVGWSDGRGWWLVIGLVGWSLVGAGCLWRSRLVSLGRSGGRGWWSVVGLVGWSLVGAAGLWRSLLVVCGGRLVKIGSGGRCMGWSMWRSRVEVEVESRMVEV